MKYRDYLWLICSLAGLLGLILWLIIRHWTCDSLDWMLVFIGFPAALSWFATVIWFYNHEIEDQKTPRK